MGDSSLFKREKDDNNCAISWPWYVELPLSVASKVDAAMCVCACVRALCVSVSARG